MTSTSRTSALVCTTCATELARPALAPPVENPITRGVVGLWLAVWGFAGLTLAAMLVIIRSPETATDQQFVAVVGASSLLVLTLAAQLSWARPRPQAAS